MEDRETSTHTCCGCSCSCCAQGHNTGDAHTKACKLWEELGKKLSTEILANRRRLFSERMSRFPAVFPPEGSKPPELT